MKYVCTYQRAGGWYGSSGTGDHGEGCSSHTFFKSFRRQRGCLSSSWEEYQQEVLCQRDERGSDECGQANLEKEQQSEYITGNRHSNTPLLFLVRTIATVVRFVVTLKILLKSLRTQNIQISTPGVVVVAVIIVVAVVVVFVEVVEVVVVSSSSSRNRLVATVEFVVVVASAVVVEVAEVVAWVCSAGGRSSVSCGSCSISCSCYW